jgi:TolB-like protein/Tfp pilus assembly protein PilF
MGETENQRSVRFAEFVLDLSAGELHKAGRTKPISLPEQPLQVLRELLRHPGLMVSREELIQKLWLGGGYGDFDHGLNKAVNRLRETLSDSAETPRFIETLPRRGYRFIAPVTNGSTIPVVAITAEIASLAVLPLVNMTGDPETEYLSDGISESIINSLSRFPNLRVIPRTSAFRYKGRQADLKKVGRDLKVHTVLTGKLIQRGDRMVVQAELVDVANDAQLWGAQFSRKPEDIFDVQEQVARQICENLRVQLTPEDDKHLAKRPTQNREAYQFLLKAHYYLTKSTAEGLRQGLACARQSIDADPGCAAAYAYLSSAYTGLGLLGFLVPAETFPRAKAAALRALEIDDSLAEAHSVLGIVRLYYEWDWVGAEAALRRALELNPNYAWGHAHLSDWLLIMGRYEESIAEQDLAVELDPLSPSLIFKLGQKLSYGRDYDRALEQIHKALELDPNFEWAHIFLAEVLAWTARIEESLSACEKVADLSGATPYTRGLRGLILGITGKIPEAKAVLNDFKKGPKPEMVALISLAETYSVLGEKDEAFELLEAAYQQRVSMLVFLAVMPTFGNIRTDSRYLDLLRRMGLPGLMNG